mgnify:CR=1 FL=1
MRGFVCAHLWIVCIDENLVLDPDKVIALSGRQATPWSVFAFDDNRVLALPPGG